MKKIIPILLCLTILIFGICCVSSTNMVSHDFGNFTMNIPEDFTLVEGIVSNSLIVQNENQTVILDDPSESHPIWKDEAHGITIEYINFEEDGFSGYDIVHTAYLDNPMYEASEGNCYVYTHDGEYIIVNVQDGDQQSNPASPMGGKAVVIIRADIDGADLDLLKEMSSSIKFK